LVSVLGDWIAVHEQGARCSFADATSVIVEAEAQDVIAVDKIPYAFTGTL
jgi:hypothetical protein